MGYMDGFYREVEKVGVVPVVVLDRVEDALPVADVLVRGGLPSAEVTFRTSCAADAIHEMSEKCPDLLVGAGTVLNLEQARRAVDAGARYIVSPGYNMQVVDWCLEHEVPVLPAGVYLLFLVKFRHAREERTRFSPLLAEADTQKGIGPRSGRQNSKKTG